MRRPAKRAGTRGRMTIDALATEMRAGFAEMRAEMRKGFADVSRDIAEMRVFVHEEFRRLTDTREAQADIIARLRVCEEKLGIR